MNPDHLMILQGKNITCKKHIEGIKSQFEIVQFFNMMIEETMADPLFKGFCGKNAEEGTPASIQKIPEVLLSVLPLCCFLGGKRVEEIKHKIKPAQQHPAKLNIPERTLTPMEFIQYLGWKQVCVIKDKSQAEAYGKGYADARKKSDVVILDIQTSGSEDHQYEIWARKINDGPAPGK
ncbi:MAG: hypothetical protein ACHQYP_09235 [Nitrospiria bacterium]